MSCASPGDHALRGASHSGAPPRDGCEQLLKIYRELEQAVDELGAAAQRGPDDVAMIEETTGERSHKVLGLGVRLSESAFRNGVQGGISMGIAVGMHFSEKINKLFHGCERDLRHAPSGSCTCEHRRSSRAERLCGL